MATMKVFGSKGSGDLTPGTTDAGMDSLAGKGRPRMLAWMRYLSQIDMSGKTTDVGMDALAESGSQSPRFIGEVNIAAMKSDLLQAENEQSLWDFGVGPSSGPSGNSLDADTRKVTSSMNFEPRCPAFIAVPPPPVLDPGFVVRKDWFPALHAKHVKSQIISEQVASKASAGHPFNCVPACGCVKRKGGCQDGESCLSCHHFFRSQAQATALEEKSIAKSESENAKLRETKTQANSLVSLLEGEGPSGVQVKGAVMAEISLGTIGHPLTCAKPCDSDAGLVIELDAAIATPNAAPIISTHPAGGQPQAYPTPQDAPHQMAWCFSVGSVGHPFSCARACKYAMKAKGCKDGANCDHCHLCHFKRLRH